MAVQDPTTNYGFNIPNDGGDVGAWGAILREIFGEDATSAIAPNGGLDKLLQAVSDVADAALARAGGTMTGNVAVLTEDFTTVDLGSMSGSVDMDLALANAFFGTATSNPTLTFSNVPASPKAVYVTLEITNGGSQVITWPAGTEWPGGSPPTLTSSGRDIITFYTRDGGTTWSAAVSMLDLS